MRVAEIIERLQRDYKPDDNLLVFYWDKDGSWDALGNEDELILTDDGWDRAVADYESNVSIAEERLGEDICEMLFDYAQKVEA